MKHDITKLPQWAQSHIKVLETDRDAYKKRAYAVTISEEEGVLATDTEVGPNYPESRFLPMGTTIRFHGTAGHIDVCVTGRGIQVHGYEPLKVKPESSNLLTIEVEPWY